MTCREIADFLLGYQSGELSDKQRRCFDEHLDECPDCVEFVRTYHEAIRLGRLACAEDHAVHADVPEDLVRAILDARSRNGG